MSYCACPDLEFEHQQALLDTFINNLKESGEGLTGWNLLRLQTFYKSVQDIASVEEFKRDVVSTIPFRGGPCPRSLRCCGMCVRQCRYRCIQDCLTRAHMWKQTIAHLSAQEQEQQGNSLRLTVASIEAARDLETISWVVGDVLSRRNNPVLKEYMRNANLRAEENPYKLDYAPQYEVRISEKTGKRYKVASKETGVVTVHPWPDTGLCPFCLPGITHKRQPGKTPSGQT